MIKATNDLQQALQQVKEWNAIVTKETDKAKRQQALAYLNRAYFVYQTIVVQEKLERELQNETA